MLGSVYTRESIIEGHDQCDARSDRRRPCIRLGASNVGGGVAVMKCGLAGRPCAWVIYRSSQLGPDTVMRKVGRRLSHTCWKY